MVASTKSNRSHTPRKAAPTPHAIKKTVKANNSILNFFKKTERPEESLFVGPSSNLVSFDAEDIYGDEDAAHRFNENVSPVKKRKTSPEIEKDVKDELVLEDKLVLQQLPNESRAVKEESHPQKIKARVNAPFIMDSDSEDDADDEKDTITKETTLNDGISTPINETLPDLRSIDKEEAPLRGTLAENAISLGEANGVVEANAPDNGDSFEARPPPLKAMDSIEGQFDGIDDDLDMAEFDSDTFEGEEMREMRFMQEQARLEAEEAGGVSSEDLGDDPLDDGVPIQSCPICEGSLAGISSDEAARHVNACLDGNPIPIPTPASQSTPVKKEKIVRDDEPEVQAEEVGKRFARAAVPRPGQRNPLELGGGGSAAPKSAFSKLMSNNAEDSAWASAAAAEHASRGRPAYERTCPFYKIMPNFSICVDAFRYGAVEGCKAYFLSHFHSDHYIGLTANWRHGPIYCSQVTGSLVKQQLRTAAKWVVELEFEKPYDVPGTGATVTMMPANHCPGSSLFLFQKPEKNGPNSRMKRILHCGDFRACPEHVGHPLLKPVTQDVVSGKLRQQKIDICYLDTTYLNPRYSFPPQDDVIKACADLCASMSPDPECKDDVWERSAKALGTPAVSKYFQSVKSEADVDTPVKAKPPQRLLVICGTYSIGKERICVAIAKALNSKIFASPGKIKICNQLQDPELSSRLTSDPLEAQVHMQMLMEIRAETLQEYLNSYKPHFSRIVGFRPSGWNFRPPSGKNIGANTSPGSVPTQQILHGKGWRSRFGYRDFTAQRGSTKEAMCFGVPYSEHSSFRELAMFIMSLNIEKVIPTVNVGSEQSRKRMKGWLDRWASERRKGGLLRPLVEGHDDETAGNADLWEGKSAKGGAAWW